jgi:hypothetical protein
MFCRRRGQLDPHLQHCQSPHGGRSKHNAATCALCGEPSTHTQGVLQQAHHLLRAVEADEEAQLHGSVLVLQPHKAPLHAQTRRLGLDSLMTTIGQHGLTAPVQQKA